MRGVAALCASDPPSAGGPLVDSGALAEGGDRLRGALEAAALARHWRATPGDGLYVTDPATLTSRLAAARARFGRSCARAGSWVVGTALARLEGRFLQEWLVYHLWVGYAHFVVYVNNAAEEDDGTDAALAPFVAAGLVTQVAMPGPLLQGRSIDDAVHSLRKRLCHLPPPVGRGGGVDDAGLPGGLRALPECAPTQGGQNRFLFASPGLRAVRRRHALPAVAAAAAGGASLGTFATAARR